VAAGTGDFNMDSKDEDEMVDIDSWEKCPHGYSIDPEDELITVKIVGFDKNNEPELDFCSKCLEKSALQEMLSDKYESGEASISDIKDFLEHLFSKDSHGPQD
jgi:hypothetical protein